jgi:serine/threonine protein kinase
MAAASRSALKPAAQTVGRFELRRPLGQGAQAVVWLAHDPRLDREVALKLMRREAAGDAASVDHWLAEARAVSRLTHPHIVQVFEADTHAGQPYLVFAYVAGRTLSDAMRAEGAMPPHAAVALVADVLDALAVAHAGGIVHRDLKPSNILVDAAGKARVMDFGIAARLSDGHDGTIAGTPGYMSPEAAKGAPPAPAMDVFAAAVMLVEMLSGQRLVAERDPYRAIHRVVHEDLMLPAALPPAVDDKLRALLLRGLARQPSQRIASAGEFRDALRQWAAPKPDGDAAGAAAGNGTLDFLLRRMRHKSDFPALSDAVARIQKVASSEHENLNSLAGEILKDVALTNKLLRLVNTVSYSHAGGGTISTISRAVALVGFAGIRNLALSLVLLEHMQDKSHAARLREEFLRALMAGSLARELAPLARETEEAFIGAMFQNLGRLLTEFYFPEEARQVRGMVDAASRSGANASPSDGETQASASVLGLSFEELGLGVAKVWGLPDNLQRCMRKPEGEPPAKMPETAGERLRWLTFAANRLTDTLLFADPARAPDEMAALGAKLAPALGIAPRQVEAATNAARTRLRELCNAMNLQVPAASPARRLLADTIEPAPAEHDTLAPHTLEATVMGELPDATLVTPRDDAAQILAAGVADITNSMVESFKLNEVLRMILETMFRALRFRRIVFCLRDPKKDALTGRFGLGDDVEKLAPLFHVPLSGGADLFATVCAKGADVLISDASQANIAARLPAWYRSSVKAPAFLLLPLAMKGAPFALIYADRAQPGVPDIGERELSLVRTLRNQAVMAFRQANG